MDNLSQNIEEALALSSIYDSEWKAENESGTEYSMQITPDVKLFITLTPEYPTEGPPKYELLAPLMTFEEKRQIAEEFRKIYEDSLGSPVLFQWIESLKELVTSRNVFSHAPKEEVQEDIKPHTFNVKDCNLNIVHGPLIQDRKSVFQGHACKVTSQQDVRNFMECLLENKKVAQATHNITAYRIKLSSGGLLQDCDDDGETHAGSRLLHLLQVINVENVMVVVTRWYGGIHLGPDRFRHINNAARQVLVEAGFISR